MWPMPVEEQNLTEDLEASIVCLPPDYQVMVGWDPQLNRDVGWITLKRGVEFDFASFQISDYNLNIRGSGSEVVGLKSSTNSTDTKLSLMHDFKEALRSKDFTMEGSTGQLPLQRPGACNDWATINKDLVTCSYCNRKVTHIPSHEKKCQVKNAKNQKRVECPYCDFKPTSAGISNHIRSHFRTKRTCPFCKNVVLEEKYESHLKKCSRCSVCGKLYKNKFLLLKHREVAHSGMQGQSYMTDEQGDIKCTVTVDKEKNSNIVNVSGTSYDDRSEVRAPALKGKIDYEHSTGINNQTSFSSTAIVGNKFYEDGHKEVESSFNCESESSAEITRDEYFLKEAECRLQFEFRRDQTLIRKNIKTLMCEPVEKAMKKFCAYKKFTRLFGSKLEDLEFMSNDTLLTGDEYAGSIEDGLIKVNEKSEVDRGHTGGRCVEAHQSYSTILDSFSQDLKKDWPVFRSSKALLAPAPTYEDVDHDEMEIGSTEIVVQFAEF